MEVIRTGEVRRYVEHNIGSFHTGRLESLRKLKLTSILRRKNPYLFRARNILLAQDMVRILLDAHLSSQEETIFGNFLEGLAIFVNQKAFDGWKSSTQGIDLEFNKDGTRYIVAIKSGPNWGNSSQIKKMQDDFRKAKQVLRTGNASLNVVAVNGCCYGRNARPDRGDYFKYCGQRFWEFISGNPDLYLRIVKPLGHSARERNDEFQEEYAQIANKFTIEFSERFVTDGQISWDTLVRFNSAETKATTDP